MSTRPNPQEVDPFRVAEIARQEVQRLTDQLLMQKAIYADLARYADGLEKELAAAGVERTAAG